MTPTNGFKRLATDVPYQSQPKVEPIQNHSGATLRIPSVPVLLRTTCMEHSPLAVPHVVHTRDLGVLYWTIQVVPYGCPQISHHALRGICVLYRP